MMKAGDSEFGLQSKRGASRLSLQPDYPEGGVPIAERLPSRWLSCQSKTATAAQPRVAVGLLSQVSSSTILPCP
jgi:hypothetical protein